MKQKTLAAIFPLVLAVTLFAGCDKEPPKPQAVVINIGTIVETTGFNEEIKKSTAAMRQQISEEVGALSDRLSKEIKAEMTSLGDSPSEEDEKKIITLRNQARQQILQVRNEGNARLAKKKAEVRKSYLDGIMSVAQKIALENGASIVLKAGGVFWTDESVDITDEVIRRMSEGKDTQPADMDQVQE